MRRVDLNLVVVLDALLAERNLTRAGERLGMSPSAVSGALARLRGLFDDSLLVRSGRGFDLTPRARSLQPLAAECAREVRMTLGAAPSFEPEASTRVLHVMASDYALSEITGPLLRLLAHEAPSTRVEFSSLPSHGGVTPEDLLTVDVCIAGTGRGVPGKRMSLFSDRFVCLADADNPLLDGSHLSLTALGRARHVQSVLAAEVGTHVDDMLMAAGIHRSVALSVSGFLSLPFAVAGTPWIGWVPERTARRCVSALGLVIATTPVEPALLVEAAHWHPSKTDDPALRWLVTQLRRASAEVDGPAWETQSGDR